jgi:hypothetical protein
MEALPGFSSGSGEPECSMCAIERIAQGTDAFTDAKIIAHYDSFPIEKKVPNFLRPIC